MKTRPYTGHLAMFFANMIWGLMAPISKDTLNYFESNDIPAFTLAAMRVLGATAAYWILSVFVRSDRTTWADRRKFFMAGMFSIVFNQCLFIVGVSFTTPVDASVITTMLPVVTMLMAALVLREPITGLKVVGVLLGMGGALLLIMGGGTGLSFGTGNIIGDLMCLAAQVSFSCYLVFYRDFIVKFSPLTLMKWMFTAASLVFLPIALPIFARIDFAAIPPRIYLEICYTVFAATFLTYMMIPIGQKSLRPTVISMYNYVQPVMSAAVSLLWGMATFGLYKGIAIGLIFSGVYVVTQSKSRAQLDTEKQTADK